MTMGDRRPQAVSEEAMVLQFEEAIKSLVSLFRKHPYVFYTETDMHCYLYHRLYAKGTFNGRFKTGDNHETILLHKEFPTKARYRRQQDKTLENDPKARRRGRFDICIWDPKQVSSLGHREQRVLIAAELALDECGKNSVHTINDRIKLGDKDNDIKYGYLLFFVRDKISNYKLNEGLIVKKLKEASASLRVLFVLVDEKGKKKPKPWSEGDWVVKI
jgi:hypothetical protein